MTLSRRATAYRSITDSAVRDVLIGSA
jgi:hypothetical protein